MKQPSNSIPSTHIEIPVTSSTSNILAEMDLSRVDDISTEPPRTAAPLLRGANGANRIIPAGVYRWEWQTEVDFAIKPGPFGEAGSLTVTCRSQYAVDRWILTVEGQYPDGEQFRRLLPTLYSSLGVTSPVFQLTLPSETPPDGCYVTVWVWPPGASAHRVAGWCRPRLEAPSGLEPHYAGCPYVYWHEPSEGSRSYVARLSRDDHPDILRPVQHSPAGFYLDDASNNLSNLSGTTIRFAVQAIFADDKSLSSPVAECTLSIPAVPSGLRITAGPNGGDDGSRIFLVDWDWQEGMQYATYFIVPRVPAGAPSATQWDQSVITTSASMKPVSIKIARDCPDAANYNVRVIAMDHATGQQSDYAEDSLGCWLPAPTGLRAYLLSGHPDGRSVYTEWQKHPLAAFYWVGLDTGNRCTTLRVAPGLLDILSCGFGLLDYEQPASFWVFWVQAVGVNNRFLSPVVSIGINGRADGSVP